MRTKLLSLISILVLCPALALAGAGTLNLTIEQGTTYEYTITYSEYDADNPPTYAGTAVDLTDYTARAQIRKSVGSNESLIELTTENGGITLGGAAGTIKLSMSATETAALTDSGVYDLELINAAGEVTRIVAGSVILDKEVTR